MSYFGLNPVNQNQQLDEAASNPAGFNSDVGFFDNAVGAALSGLYSGLVAKPDQLLWAGMDKIVSPIAQFVNENTSLNDTSVSYIAEQRKLAEQQVKRLTPDAATTGTAGQVLYGLFDMGGQAVVGTTLGGPVGGAAAVTSLQGFLGLYLLVAPAMCSTVLLYLLESLLISQYVCGIVAIQCCGIFTIVQQRRLKLTFFVGINLPYLVPPGLRSELNALLLCLLLP
jgi:hypothetical protein